MQRASRHQPYKVPIVAAMAVYGCMLVNGVVNYGCGDGSNRDGVTLVHVFGKTVPGHKCPSGTTEAYRRGNILGCNSCATDADCAARQTCAHICAPGCDESIGSCGCI